MRGLVMALLAVGATPALAWGSNGHRLVSRLAIESLPSELPAFLREAETANMIGELGIEADRLREAGTSHDRSHSPDHFINLDDSFLAAGSISMDPPPATREDFDTALRLAGSNQYRTGTLPYAIIEGWQQVLKDFTYWRMAEDKERHAKTRSTRTRFAKERRLREMLIIRDIGYWSHFVADASQPMHVSMHTDGWRDNANPLGFRTSKGFHKYLETTFVTRHVKAADVREQIPPLRDCKCSIEVRTIDYLRASHSQLLPLYSLEKNGGFSPTPAGREFAIRRLAAASAELRDLIVSAWRESDKAQLRPQQTLD